MSVGGEEIALMPDPLETQVLAGRDAALGGVDATLEFGGKTVRRVGLGDVLVKENHHVR